MRRNSDDTLLGLDRVLLVLWSPRIEVSARVDSLELEQANLVTENTLNTLDAGTLVLVKNLLDGGGDLPVLRSGLDGADGSLSGLVSGSEEVGTDLSDGGRGGGDDDAVSAEAEGRSARAPREDTDGGQLTSRRQRRGNRQCGLRGRS